MAGAGFGAGLSTHLGRQEPGCAAEVRPIGAGSSGACFNSCVGGSCRVGYSYTKYCHCVIFLLKLSAHFSLCFFL